MKHLRAFGLLVVFVLLAGAPLLAQETALSPVKANLYKWAIIIGGRPSPSQAAGATARPKPSPAAARGSPGTPARPPHPVPLIFGLR
jgi:hypothetical protein